MKQLLEDKILTGDESKQMLYFLLAENGNKLNYQVLNEDRYLCKGYHPIDNGFIAIDNTSGNCNVEEFELEEDAIRWLCGNYKEPVDFKGKTSAC